VSAPGRKIIHVDMDAFYASVEQRDAPELRGRPVIVGGTPNSRGVVAACSYEARAFGVHSAMPASQAERLCPHGVFLRPRMARYVEVSRQLRDIFRSVTDMVEPLCLDEAYLDVTDNRLDEPLAGKIARHLKREIWQRTGLVASAGVGPSKLVAKIASDLDKPDGFRVVPPEEVERFLAPLPVTRLWGVGPATAERLSALSIKTVADVRRVDPSVLERSLGKYGLFLARLSVGDDDRPVVSRRKPKSRGSETTFAHDISDPAELLDVLQRLADDVWTDLSSLELKARSVTLKVRYGDFTTVTRSRSRSTPLASGEELLGVARDLMLHSTEAGERPVRLLGVSTGSFMELGEPEQLCLPWSTIVT